MAQIYDSSHSGQEIDAAVDAVQTTIPSQLTQIGSKVDENGIKITALRDIVPRTTAITNDADMAFSDGNKDILRVKDGHIITKDFNSSQSTKVKSLTDDADLAFSDGDKDIFRVKNGYPQTKNFNGEDVAAKARHKSPLFGKKWAVCGDSFTNGGWKASEITPSDYISEEGLYKGYKKVYGYIIANRNDMQVQWLAKGGRTMAYPSDGTFENAFVNGMYTTIDSDVDYITLYFGINDSHHESGTSGTDDEDTTGTITLGTIDSTDISTFYGAYQTVLRYLLEYYPSAHIGIIVSNGCDRAAFPEATIEIAKKWGIPYIDLNGDSRTPFMNRSTNTSIASAARNARNNAFRVSATNTHPNAMAQEFEATFIENFLKSI
jgi:hypothetical protein